MGTSSVSPRDHTESSAFDPDRDWECGSSDRDALVDGTHSGAPGAPICEAFNPEAEHTTGLYLAWITRIARTDDVNYRSSPIRGRCHPISP